MLYFSLPVYIANHFCVLVGNFDKILFLAIWKIFQESTVSV